MITATISGNNLEGVKMAQRKLKDSEHGVVRTVRFGLELIETWDKDLCSEGVGNALAIARTLVQHMETHGTTDGKPYVEPQPPIPDGYRLAVAGDEGRKDMEYRGLGVSQWTKRNDPGRKFLEGYTYIVPIDRTPTDEEAAVIPRIEVMVRDFASDPWQKKTLFAVRSAGVISNRFVTDRGSWKHCRHLYPGE